MSALFSLPADQYWNIVYLSVIFVSLPFILRVWTGYRNRVFITGIIVLVFGKLIEGGIIPISLPPFFTMYLADPIVLGGALLLFSGLGGSMIQAMKGTDRRMVGGLFVAGSILATVMYGMSYVMQAPDANNWHYWLVSVVWYVAWSAIALSYLDMTNYHPLAFLGAFFAIFSIIVCYSYDGFAWAGLISYDVYGAAPWDFMYLCETLAGVFTVIAVIHRTRLKRVTLPASKMTRAEKVLIPGILVIVAIIVLALMSPF